MAAADQVMASLQRATTPSACHHDNFSLVTRNIVRNDFDLTPSTLQRHYQHVRASDESREWDEAL